MAARRPSNLLEWPADLLAEDNAIPQNLSYFVAQHHETLRPDFALLEDGKPRLLISVLPPAQQPDRRPPSTTWNATCAARMAELLRATRVPLGMVTNGERFTLVYAEPEKPTGFADFRAELWFDERLTLRAFRDFLSAGALFNRPPDQTLDALYRRSLENQQEVSTTLGRQVRRAVEMFVAALDRADRESGRALLQGIAGEHIYEAALTLMMRLVFLFFAEERDLLPITNPVYRENYAVSTLHDQLREAADRLGEEVLERRYDAFPRLLAGFRAVHGGIVHDLAALPAYGGDLFDPDRFPFLEGRAPGSDWRNTPAQPCPIHNRTVLHLLGALQFLEMKVPGGGREKRRLSFRALDIEQIGHVYEGLLDHTARKATEIVLGLDGKEEIEVALSDINRRRAQPDFIEWLADETGCTAKAMEKALAQTAVEDPLRWPEWEQVAPFAGLVRRDDNGDPWVIPADSLYVTVGTTRRQTGTQYTPRSLTESVVEHALAPLVYTGPAEGQPPEAWRLKPAGQILDLKICDFACGSAAFLVAAARYLSARLVEAWDSAQHEHGKGVQITPYGHPSSGLPEEDLIPVNPDERGLYALRIVVERCLYGVDRNPLAVEMAKLSLWLLTLQRNRPFTFLDHAIRCGDSLLGVDLRQLSTWSLSGEGTQSVLFNDDLSFAADKREGLMKMQYRTGDQRRLLDAALAKTRRLRAAADRLIATAFEVSPAASAAAVSMALEAQEAEARKILLGKRPFHWPVEFPEVFLHGGGFDCVLGNPPFMAGRSISANLGDDYLKYLRSLVGSSVGQTDLCAYFFRRAHELLKLRGTFGLLGTNTIAEGDTGRTGLAAILGSGGSFYSAVSSERWPGTASVFISQIHSYKGAWKGLIFLDGKRVAGLDQRLQPCSDLSESNAFPLTANEELSFKGADLGGLGFALDSEEAQAFVADFPDERSIIQPYYNGLDVYSSPTLSTNRMVINLSGLTLDQVQRQFPHALELVRERVKPYRDTVKPEGTRTRWWLYARDRPAMRTAVAKLSRALIKTQVSETWAFVFLPTNVVFDQRLVVFPFDDFEHFGVLQSDLHYVWASTYAASLKGDMSYTPSDCFDTFPLPESANTLSAIGERYHTHRRDIMIARREGLTTTYNRFHSPHEVSHDIATLRALHVEMDHAVAAAYDWTGLDLGHGFHQTKQGLRYTISEAVRRTVLDRLLALNHERYAAEQSAALASAPHPASKRKARSRAPGQAALSIF